MSSSNTSHQFQYMDKEHQHDVCNEDPLSLLEEKIKELKEESENSDECLTGFKRKLTPDIHPFKKPRHRNDNESVEQQQQPQQQQHQETAECEKENNQKMNIENDEITHDNENKDEIEIKEEKIDDSATESGDKSEKKEKEKKDHHDRKVQNLRKNIKEVIDDTQLDATTLAAQRQESERLARLQEAQRQMREIQRQQAAEKQANKTQQKVLSLLGGDEPVNSSSSAIDLDDPLFEKLSLNPAISITPASKEALQSIQSLISTDEKVPDSDDDDVIIQPDESIDKSKAVVVDSSSDSDDCIILSDEEEEEEEDEDDDNNSGEHTNDLYNKPDAEGRVVINIGHSESESDIYVAPQIARVIKPHQIGGVRFLFDNIIESIELFEKSTGFGCILAHSMGLGKTLQLVCFCDIFLRHTISKTILIIMPINTLQNWVNEFNMWIPLPDDVEKCPLNAQGEVRARNFKIHVLNDSHKSLSMRAKVILEWKNEGGVLMMGYEMYRLLSLKKCKPKKKKGSMHSPENDLPSNEDQDFFDKIYEALVNPGPDLVVCDEGHRIKNAAASTSLALKQIKSKRRIVLTGYPLQNNLLEYWCMVDFVRPNYLGTKTEFSNMFERPIQNGQCIDSTPQDRKLMRYRAHVLHSLLKGFVQRRSHAVLQKCLPEKTEHVLLVRLTPFQRKLYTVFMDEVVRSKKVPNPLKAFSVCCKIWNHPDVLYNFLKKRELDLEIELEEAENDRKTDSNIKKRGRKIKDSKKSEDEKLSIDRLLPTTTTTTMTKVNNNDINPVKLDATTKGIPTVSDPFKPPVTPSSNDSAYSSNQSLTSSYDNTYNSYSNYQNYDASNPYQNYNYNTNGSYQNWNGNAGTNYWQNNYYQNDYYSHTNSYQSYYGNQNNMQMTDTKPSLLPPTTVKEESKQDEVKSSNNNVSTGGLLADVIQKETKEQLEKKEDIADSIVLKNSNSSRDDGIPYEWAVELMKDYVPDLLENSPKMEIFFCILNESIKINDRLLVFSQSLLTLNLLERFLQRTKIPNTDTYWMKNQSYFRLDGSTPALEREKLINEFNANSNLKLFLVSTRAGSLGINLVGANRVIVFDASFNPSHDTQAVCRVYRYGQSKSCFVYRLVVDNCLEKKIYDRQINKQGMADRVIDECNPDAHLSMKEVTSLCYDDGEDPELADFGDKIDNFEDLIVKKVLCGFSKTLTKEPFLHESLLVDRKEKKLSQAEKRLAQRGYEMEKQAAAKPTYNYNNNSTTTNYRLFRTPDGTLIQRPIISNPRVQTITEIAQQNQNSTIRPENPKPNRWVPVEVWQSKGITAQEMTLPQDVSIQTNSADKSKIFLKAGQKVIVLKSPRGICLQLESGKVIAIRASMKPGQSPSDMKTPSFPGITDAIEANLSSSVVSSLPTKSGSEDVIDMTNSDDEEANNLNKVLEEKATLQPINGNINTKTIADNPMTTNNNGNSEDHLSPFKEKAVYKPNLVHRKPKMPPPSTTTPASMSTATTTTSSMYGNNKPYTSNYQPQHWSRYQNHHSTPSSSSTSSSNYFRDMNGGSSSSSNANNSSSSSTNKDQTPSYPNPISTVTTTAPKSNNSNHSRGYSMGNSSAFHAPSTASYQNSYMQPPPPHYQSHHNSYAAAAASASSSYQNPGYNYPSNYNYYPHSYSRGYNHYPPQHHHSNYDPQQFSYHGYGSQYNPTSSFLPSSYSNASSSSSSASSQIPVTTTTTTSTSTTSASSYGQWNWNK